MRALLDVNVLVALLDTAHVHHAQARAWLMEHSSDGWASCPITQNGCVRVMAQAVPGLTPGAAAAMLRAATETEFHAFWSDGPSLLDGRVARWEAILGQRQITDAYLLALAVAHRGRFVTFDRSVPIRSVVGATARHLVVL